MPLRFERNFWKKHWIACAAETAPHSISFTVSTPKVKAVKESLIEEAVLNAKVKAEIAIKPLDQKIVGVNSIIVDDVGYSPSPMFERADMFTSSAPIFSSEQDISVNVNVIFLIADR